MLIVCISNLKLLHWGLNVNGLFCHQKHTFIVWGITQAKNMSIKVTVVHKIDSCGTLYRGPWRQWWKTGSCYIATIEYHSVVSFYKFSTIIFKQIYELTFKHAGTLLIFQWLFLSPVDRWWLSQSHHLLVVHLTDTSASKPCVTSFPCASPMLTHTN